jgi:ubiquinone/menaquinone biosynthesis C-methylase UbiE
VVEMPTSASGDWTELTRRAFDAAAPVYDSLYEGLHGIRKIRRITTGMFLKYFPPGASLLEMNCGTGNDAITLAQQGMRVVATDISSRMLAEAARKAVAAGVAASIEFMDIPFSQLPRLTGRVFDGVYSNLGGLNCTDRLHDIASVLGTLIKPGGHLIAAVMPRFCLWESTAFAARLKFKQAGRRISRRGTAAHLHGGTVQTFYHSPREFRRAFAPMFDHVETVGLCVLVPPPNFERTYLSLGNIMGVLDRTDEFVARLPLFRSIGDHYAVVLRRGGG